MPRPADLTDMMLFRKKHGGQLFSHDSPKNLGGLRTVAQGILGGEHFDVIECYPVLGSSDPYDEGSAIGSGDQLIPRRGTQIAPADVVRCYSVDGVRAHVTAHSRLLRAPLTSRCKVRPHATQLYCSAPPKFSFHEPHTPQVRDVPVSGVSTTTTPRISAADFSR